MPSIACVSIVGKENQPLWMRMYKDGLSQEALDVGPRFGSAVGGGAQIGDEDQVLRFHFLMNSALDIVEERHREPLPKPGRAVAAGSKSQQVASRQRQRRRRAHCHATLRQRHTTPH